MSDPNPNPQELAPEMHAAYARAMNLLSDNEVLSNHKVLVDRLQPTVP